MKLPHRRFYFSIFILFSILYIFFFTKSWGSVSGNIYTDDDYGYLAYIISLVNDFDVDFSNHDLNIYKWINPDNGKMLIGNQMGTSILLIPFYLISKPIVLFISHIRGVPFNEKDPLFFVILCSAIAMYFYMGSVYLRNAMRHFFSEIASDLGVILTVWGTILPVYVFRRPIFPHVLDFFLVSILVYILARCYKEHQIRIRESMLLGLISGLDIVTRCGNIHIIIFVVFAIYYLVIIKRSSIGEFIKNICIFEGIYLFTVFSIFILTQGLVWKSLFGGYFAFLFNWLNEYEDMTSRPVLLMAGRGFSFIWFFFRNFIHILVGLDWGILYTMPSLLIGIFIFIFKSPFNFFEKRIMQYVVNSLIIAVPFIIILRLGNGGEFYGYRYLLSLLPLSVFGTAVLLEKIIPYSKRVVVAVCLLFCIFNFLVILPFDLTEATNLHPDNISPLGHKGWGNNRYVINSVKFYFISDKKTLVSAFVRGYLGAYIFGGLSVFGADLSKYSQKLKDYFTLNEYKKWVVLLYPFIVFLFIFGIHPLVKKKL